MIYIKLLSRRERGKHLECESVRPKYEDATSTVAAQDAFTVLGDAAINSYRDTYGRYILDWNIPLRRKTRQTVVLLC